MGSTVNLWYSMGVNQSTAMAAIPYAPFHVVRFRESGECVHQAHFRSEDAAESYYDAACEASPNGYFDVLSDAELRETL